MTRKAKTCFIYVRVSTKMQVENGESIEAQLYDLRQYAKRENLRILHEYIDDGYSGKNITGRPHFQEMMEEIKSGVHVDYVLVFKLSRFGRNAADALSSLQFMQDYGTNLVCVKDGINSEAQMGKMMIAFMSAFAEMERENILVQTMAGREQKAREGKWNGGQAPFGYRLVKDEKGKGHLEIDEDEAEIVRIIFREYTKNGKGVHAIASWLNTQGYRKKIRGNSKYEHFAPGTVKNIIRNPVYAGKIAFGRRRTTPVKGERNVYHMVKQDNFDIYEGEHDAIIDEATWNAAQKRLAEDSHPFPEAKPDGHTHLLTGMLVFSTHILSDVERICTDVAFLNDGVVNIQGKLSDIKSQYRTEEYVLETGNEEELKLLMNVFAGLKKSGINTASFRENDHTLFDILRFVTDNRIRLLKIERVEPTLETLFMEVVEK